MSDIFDLPSVWRASLMPASFNGARFHCDSNAWQSGRRIVQHVFPKKDLPYAEDMGRASREFSIRGYCITYIANTGDPLFNLDYRIARDLLMGQLETEGPGVLQLPTKPAQTVVCPRYRMQEDARYGGFCTFDMTFMEYGIDPALNPSGVIATASVVGLMAQALRDQVLRVLSPH